MRVSSVKLTNFLSHADTTVKFNNGVNVIVGPNGAGKSSIVDAILFALFRESTRGSISELVRKGQRRGWVELSLVKNSDTYIIRRELTSANPQDILFLNNTPINRSAKTVSSAVKELLKIDRGVLTSTVFVSQGKIEEVLESLGEVLSSLLRLDKISKLVDTQGPIKALLTDVQSSLKVAESNLKRMEDDEMRIRSLEQELAEDQEKLTADQAELDEVRRALSEVKVIQQRFVQLRAARDSLLTDISNLREKLSKYESETEKLRSSLPPREEVDKMRSSLEELSKVSELRARLDRLNSLRSEVQYLQSQVKAADETLQTMEERVKKREELEPWEKEYQVVKGSLDSLKEVSQRYNILISKLRDIEEREGKLQDKIQEISKQLSSVGDLETLQTSLENTRKEANKEEAELRYIESLRRELLDRSSKIEGDICPVCERPLDDQHREKLREEIREKLSQLELQVIDIEENLNKLRGKINGLEASLRRARELTGNLAALNQELEKERRNKPLLKNEIDSLTPKLEKFKELTSREEELRRYHEEYLKLSSATREELLRLRSQAEQLKERLTHRTSELQRLQEELGNINDEKVSSMERQLRAITERLKQVEELERKLIAETSAKEETRKELERKERQLSSISYDPAQAEEADKKVQMLEERERHLIEEVSTLKGRNDQRRSEISKLSQEMDNLRSSTAEFQRLKRAEERLARLRTILGDKNLRTYLLQRAKDTLDYHLNDVAKDFNLSFSSFEVVNDDGKFTVRAYRTDREWVDVRSLSGGERVAVSLSLRLALARMTSSEMEFMVMDEPTVHLDESRRSELIDVVRNAINVVPQLIVVTHDRELEAAGDNIIEVTNEGFSKVKVSSAVEADS
jgi:ATPase involved in DNA repair